MGKFTKQRFRAGGGFQDSLGYEPNEHSKITVTYDRSVAYMCHDLHPQWRFLFVIRRLSAFLFDFTTAIYQQYKVIMRIACIAGDTI